MVHVSLHYFYLIGICVSWHTDAQPYHGCPFANLINSPPEIAASSSASFYQLRPAAAGSLKDDQSVEDFISDYLQKYGLSHVAPLLQQTKQPELRKSNEEECAVPPLSCLNGTSGLQYRSLDGSCNNLRYPGFGMAKSSYTRLLSPKFQLPSVSTTGSLLPSARDLSLFLFGEQTLPDPFRTLAAMQYGQFITHDISMLSTSGPPDDCSKEFQSNRCYSIPLAANDPIALNTGKSSLNLPRGVSDADKGCQPRSTLPQDDKISKVTGYLDLSSIYGSSLSVSSKARVHHGGLLKTSIVNGEQWPPISRNEDGECGTDPECFSLPDVRNSFTPNIAVLHTLLLREHNRIATQLARLNPHYTDERLFEEARKINIAQHQKITYYDWLPIFLGSAYSYSNGLIYHTNHPSDYINDYDITVDASPSAEYAAAAFRYGHNQIPGWFSLVAPNRDANQTLRLSDFFGRNSENVQLLTTNFDALLRGLGSQLQKRADDNIDVEIKHRFDRKAFENFGSDLKALDIQRGRDYRLASYNDLRQFCGLPRATRWSEFANEISQDKISQLQKIYAAPDNVELNIGGSLERHVPGSLFGPTFLCIVGKQFLHTRIGDRFFFERENPNGGFNREQLIEIRKASLARLYCNNANYISRIQPNVFAFPSTRNPLLNCHDIPQVDLRKWQESAHQFVY